MFLISFGTRPEYIKVKPIIEEMKKKDISFRLLFTGQHVDLLSNIKNTFCLQIEQGANRLDSIVSSLLNQEYVFEGIDSVIVQGDTTSAFAIALAAFHRKIKIIHLEAGLRTWDIENPYPEEANRQMISRIADVHLCPTETSAKNLKKELVSGSVYVVGNTVLDNLKNLTVTNNNTVIVTLHRRENHSKISRWFQNLDSLAKQYKKYTFILPIHPNPNVLNKKSLLKNVQVIEPVSYEPFLKMLASCSYVITDSGGLQEETSFLKKRSIVCRKTTERPEGLGLFSELCPEPEHLPYLFAEMILKQEPTADCPYGDGNSAEKIINILTTI
jgi:UDP-N-acetylglucosamine 2-epimerase